MVAKEAVAPVPVTGRRARRREKYTRRTMQRAMVAGGIAGFAVLAYTVPFARSAREGYAQDRIKIELQDLARDNETLHTQLANLKNPARVEAFASQSGMVMRQSAQFITIPWDAPAKPKASTFLARLATFRLH